MLAPASANVVMQLARRGVGRGVAESRVLDGSLMRHPLKRTRTTLAYIWVALLGTDDERRQMRRSVSAQHRRVRSRPQDEVAYDAYDSDLQLWVASCMFVGSLQGYETLYGTADDAVVEVLLARCSRFATTLQVSAHCWPTSRAAFEEYWCQALKEIHIDEVTGDYLRGFLDLRFLPWPVGALLRPLSRLLTVGYLTSPFRDALGTSWSARDERRFCRMVTVMRAINQWTPAPLAQLPWNLVRYDTRRRLARGRALM